MTNTIYELMKRKSVRSFTDEPATSEERTAILTSAMNAPTAGNQQLYTIIDVQSAPVRERLAVLCDNQPFIANAKMVLIFLADVQKWLDAYTYAGAKPRKPGPGDLMLAVSDACIAAQNAVTAAESLGIGSCYIGDVMEQFEEMRLLLKLPDYVFPCAMAVFGHPTEQQKKRTKPERFRTEDIVCVDEYHRKEKKELRTMFTPRAGESGFDRYLQEFCARKYGSDFAIEMNRSAEKYWNYWK